ncbi:MAG: TRAP transporter large permease [Bacillota bacterium]
MIAILIITFFVLLFSRVPVIFSLSGAALLTIYFTQPQDLIVIPQIIFAANDSFALLAIPFFILAGNFMEYSGISKRLISFFEKIVGHIPGGLGVVATISCVFFGAISGSAPATVAAIGTIMIPAMAEKGYSKHWGASLVATSGTLGAIIPPSIPLILYGVLSGTSIAALFAAAILPGLLIALCLIIYTIIYARQKGMKRTAKCTFKDVFKSGISAFWALIMPLIILGGIYSGYFTPTEAATIASVYGLLVGMFIYRELKIKQIPKIFLDTAMTSAKIMLIITFAAAFATILTRNNIPTMIANGITDISSSPIIFYALFSVFMLLLGMFMSVLPALIVLTPILAPAVKALSISPIHFGIVFVVLMLIGTISPPFGLDLFVSCGIAKLDIDKVVKEIWKFLLIYIVAAIIIIVFPAISLFIPSIFGF